MVTVVMGVSCMQPLNISWSQAELSTGHPFSPNLAEIGRNMWGMQVTLLWRKLHKLQQKSGIGMQILTAHPNVKVQHSTSKSTEMLHS